MKTPSLLASSSTPGTSVFCGLPLINEHPSSMVATAYTVEGEISFSLLYMAAITFSAVS